MIENGQPDGGYVLSYDGVRIPFRIEFRNRSRLGITVHPELRLEVVAPNGCDTERILVRVQKRAGWILKQFRYFDQFHPTHPGPRFVSGETHLYLGRQYRLKVIKDSSNSVKLVGRFLHVATTDRQNHEQTVSLVENWYRDHAKQALAHRFQTCLESSAHLIALDCEPQLFIRKMTRRWGSCTKAGTILLNADLIKAPIHCVDYVIVHELCHLKVHNHGKAFYRLLSRCLPDWERRKRRLEEFVAS